MAYAALVSLAQTIDRLQHHDQHSNIFHHEKRQIKSIHKHVIFLQSFLEDFPEKANSLEGRIRDLANEAEDIIEDFMSEQIRQYYISKSSTTKPESVRFSHHLNGMIMWLKRKKSAMYKKQIELKQLVREVVEIKNSTISTVDANLSDSSVNATPSSRLASTSKDDTMVGFDDDLMEIKARLCGEASKLQVIPILGMGGIGKTTLAKNAYRDPLIVEHFHIRVWVTVSQDYSAQEILSRLLVSLKAETSVQSNESMEELVYKSLKGRTYLIVMDDMWRTKAWDDVRMIFPDDNNGSRIMITTRLSDVAAYPDSSSPLHKMRFMDEDQSWNLLQQKVFGQENYCPPELETTGKMIARRCRGLPLAIVLIGGLLSTVDKTQASWENIARNLHLAINTTNDEQFAKILSLSYIHLPHHLKPCFLYMGSFPEDYEIHVSKLIKLWVAEGFLKPNGSKSFEQGAEEYLEDLVKRSLVLVIKRKANGKIKSCSFHDLVRDLCIKKNQEEKFLLNVMDMYVRKNFLEGVKDERRISIFFSHLERLEKVDGSTIRTIICYQHIGPSLKSFGYFKLLRVLDVVTAMVKPFRTETSASFPREVFELFHLRYLAFTHNYREIFLGEISKLQNLQTIIIRPRKKSRSYLPFKLLFPREIWEMPQLRHLVSFFTDLLPDPEGAISALENLQTMSEAVNMVCNLGILKMIPNLKKLGISYSGDRYAIYVQDYQLNNLVYLRQLEKLKLKVYEDFPFQEMLKPVFPMTLKKLTLSGLKLPWKDMGMVGSLPNLEVLKLRDQACIGEEWETSEGEFPQLKFLLIDGSHLQQWITESSHFPNLVHLVLHGCEELNEIPDGIGEIPTLELIEVDDLNDSIVDSAKRIQEEQESWGNDTLHVRIHNISGTTT